MRGGANLDTILVLKPYNDPIVYSKVILNGQENIATNSPTLLKKLEYYLSRNYMCNYSYIINIDVSNILDKIYKYIQSNH